MLHKVLKALPKEDRLAFLSEVYQSLSPDDRKLVTSGAKPGKSMASSSIKTAQTDHVPIPKDTQREAAPESVRAAQPEQSAKADTAPSGSESKEKAALVEAEFKKMIATQRSSPTDMRKQLINCFGLGILGIAIIIAMAVLGKAGFEYIVTLVEGWLA